MSDIQSALHERAKALLENGDVEYVIGWENARGENKTRPAFIRKAEDAERLVWNSWCVNSTAKYLLHDRWPKGKIAICARGCDTRAINRMLSDGQIKRENIYILGIPCQSVENQICERCAHRNPIVYDELLGEPVEEKTDFDRFAKVKQAQALTLEQRRQMWEDEFTKCIRCYACRNVCPACNCRECYADQYRTGWQGKQFNAVENRVYGLTRAYHVGDRCIECGECERVCPMDLPIMLQTGKMRMECNELFCQYECGISGSETPALGTYNLNDADSFG